MPWHFGRNAVSTGEVWSGGKFIWNEKALLRCAGEVTEDRNGLNRTRRQIVQLAAAGRSSFMDIFKGLAAFEEYPFLGDTGCQRQLDFLIRKGILIRSGEEYKLKQ